jgi:cytochrome oxidase assembly protein ShyY1
VLAYTGIGRKWRRFNRKFGSKIFIGLIVAVVIALVGLMMWALNRPR